MNSSGGLRGYVLRRILWMLPTLLTVIVLVFLVFQELADPAAIELGLGATSTELSARRHELGLDRGVGVRLVEQVADLARLDLGVSRTQRRPVGELVAAAIVPTLSYALPGFLVAMLAAIFGGLAAARRPKSGVDRALMLLATLAMSTSSLVVVLAGQAILAHAWGLAPVSWPLGASDAVPPIAYLVLPVTLWATVQFGPDLRHFRAVFVQDLRRPHFDAMRARGLPERAIRRHQLRGAAGPICARVGHCLPYLAVGSVVIEYVFNIPGVGRLVVDAIRTSDLPLMQGLTLVTTLCTLLAQVAADVLAGTLDPRLRRW